MPIRIRDSGALHDPAAKPNRSWSAGLQVLLNVNFAELLKLGRSKILVNQQSDFVG